MQVGDLVKHFLTEQIGIVIETLNPNTEYLSIQVMWTTQGDSLFGPGNKEWCIEKSLEHLTPS